MNQDWDIRPCSAACSKCGAAFVEGQGFRSLLLFNEQGYDRADYCDACWVPARSSLTGSHSAWKGVYHPPPPVPEETVKRETAESLLRKLMESEDASRKNAIYVLAVMLERKKILVERDNQKRPDGTKIIVFEHRKSGESFLIPDPGLRLTELEHVQAEVTALLQPPAPPQPAQPGETEEENE